MIIHFKTFKEGRLVSLVAEHIAQKEEDVAKLVELGAIYVEKERCLSNPILSTNTYVRVHLQPKKYFTKNGEDTLKKLDVSTWIVSDETDFYVIDKPHGLPAHPTLDNIQQNLLALLKKHLKRELWLPHRLDVGTAGLILVAKSQEAANSLQQEFIHKRIQKIYRALVERPLTPQLYEHFIKKTKTSPKFVQPVEDEETQNCLLKLTGCEAYGVSSELFRVTLEPITGRTHQIRAQLTYLKNPIVGDALYGSKQPFVCKDQELFTQESFALEAYQLKLGDQFYQRPQSTLD